MELPVVQRLRKELSDLHRELKHEIPKHLQEAASHGDLSENAEYEAAKARQDFVQARIRQIQGRIEQLSLYHLQSIPHGVVAYGSRVTVEDLDEGQSAVYEIVFPEETNVTAGQISLNSPVGRALLNKTVGDEVEVQTPRGKRSYQITDLITLHDRS
ncbi:MAG: transcription elongation factor GreA [Candidatus Binatia bacterium]